MITKFRSWLKAAIANVNLIGKEPILLVGLGIAAVNAFQSAQAGGLNYEDAAFSAVVTVLTLLGRQLVYPAVKVDAATAALKAVEEPLEKPYVG